MSALPTAESHFTCPSAAHTILTGSVTRNWTDLLFSGWRTCICSGPIFCWQQTLAIDVATGEHHYSLVPLRSCYPGNLLVFLLLNCWDGSRKSKRCWITIFVIVQNWNPTPNLLHYLLKPSSLIDSKSLYLDLFLLEVFVPLNKQVR